MAKPVTIYHNPSCGTSRKVLGMLRDAGIAPRVVEYLKTPPSRDDLKTLLRQMGMTPRQLLRRKGSLFGELGLDDPAKTDEQILDALQAHPVLMERPIVVTGRGTRVCRPPDRVADLLA
jgi:arsenate reductase (glutaredoxin)